MRTSYAMMASSVTPPTEDKGADVEGAVEAGGLMSQSVASSVEAEPYFV